MTILFLNLSKSPLDVEKISRVRSFYHGRLQRYSDITQIVKQNLFVLEREIAQASLKTGTRVACVHVTGGLT